MTPHTGLCDADRRRHLPIRPANDATVDLGFYTVRGRIAQLWVTFAASQAISEVILGAKVEFCTVVRFIPIFEVTAITSDHGVGIGWGTSILIAAHFGHICRTSRRQASS
jgi:hypothetical protein